MAFSNPDMQATPQNSASGKMYGCSALWWSDVPVNPSTVQVAKPGDANVTAAPTNVSANFILFFTAMFWISVVSLASTILGCLGACSAKCGMCACLGGCFHGLTNIAIFIMLILGSVWRWSKTGMACSGDFVTKPVSQGGNLCIWKEGDVASLKCSKELNGNMWAENKDGLGKVEWQYWNMSGGTMAVILIINYILLICMCFCSCFMPCSKKDS